jgi:REP element-mobilizing transposase RayT
MHSNIAGKIADKWWQKLEKKFDITLHEYVIMPNHIHGIIEINNPQHSVWTNSQYNVVADPCVRLTTIQTEQKIKGQTHRSVPTISTMIQWFKTMTTNEYIKEVKSGVLPPFDKRIWQRSFYDHIIRKNESLNKIREYIIINPQDWNNDEFNTLNTHKSIRT